MRDITYSPAPLQGHLRRKPDWWTDKAREHIGRLPRFRNTGPAFIYVAEIVGLQFCKVGISGDVERRAVILQTSSPFEIKIARQFGPWPKNDALIIEAMTHLSLMDRKVRGEWFRASPSYICAAICEASHLSKIEEIVEPSL